jgi:hypothetical protein
MVLFSDNQGGGRGKEGEHRHPQYRHHGHQRSEPGVSEPALHIQVGGFNELYMVDRVRQEGVGSVMGLLPLAAYAAKLIMIFFY